MEAVLTEQFFQWTAATGIGFDQRYPDSHSLSVLPPSDHARFWVLPGDPATWPHFAASLLDGLDDWSTGFLWPRSGHWPESALSQRYNEGVRDVALGAGIPDGWRGAIRFDRDEEDALLAILFVYLAFGWCGDDDLFFVPDHGRQVLQTDHHDVIHVQCASEERIQAFVAHMGEEGYQLPTELPDWTFIRPEWMGPGQK